jgi:glutamate-1-semialdehyde 2,1-aminomutase
MREMSVSFEKAEENTATLRQPSPLRDDENVLNMPLENYFPGGTLGPSDSAIRGMNGAIISNSSGAYIHSAQGLKYLDFVMGGSALILGHGNNDVVDAVSRQVPRGTHYYQIMHEPAVRFAAIMKETVPCADKIIYTSTGSDAVNQAVRIARAATGRDEILRFEGAYHGTSEVALTAMQSSGQDRPEAADTAGVPKASARLVRALAFGDTAGVAELLAREASSIAGILVDPIQRWCKPDGAFLTELRRLCTAHGVLLIFDEVVSGYRLALGGAQQYYGVIPDLAAYGKIIGGGLPIGVVAGRAEIMEVTNPLTRQGRDLVTTTGTFNGNALACAAGFATIKALMRPGVYERLSELGERSRSGLEKVIAQYKIPASVGGIESFWHIHFSPSEPRNFDDVRQSDRERARRLDGELMRRGIFVLPNGRRSLSLAHTEADVDHFISVFEDICRDGKC